MQRYRRSLSRRRDLAIFGHLFPSSFLLETKDISTLIAYLIDSLVWFCYLSSWKWLVREVDVDRWASDMSGAGLGILLLDYIETRAFNQKECDEDGWWRNRKCRDANNIYRGDNCSSCYCTVRKNCRFTLPLISSIYPSLSPMGNPQLKLSR